MIHPLVVIQVLTARISGCGVCSFGTSLRKMWCNGSSRDVCQKAKAERVPYPSLLQPLPIPHQAWSSVSMDFIEGLPKSEGRNCTSWPSLTLFQQNWLLEFSWTMFIYYNGLPTNIVTDRDKIFTSSFWKELFKLLGTNLDLSIAYHPSRMDKWRGLINVSRITCVYVPYETESVE
ncbi:UNVERIFIED_CONTAM: hypothetical protein Sradi_0924600 [Sesamum radiatum]|uniref:Integrase catalytic domain-containing protein n=1 Tax=Sesamum radiatum TaxID=300843 RepID=A0AAW2V4E4_SESRA